MSHQEIDRVGIVKLVESKKPSLVEGARQLNISSHQISEAIKSEICKLIQEKYSDFDPTLAHEKLVEQHNLKLSIESFRQIIIAEELWAPKQRKIKSFFQLRPRRARRSMAEKWSAFRH